MRHRSLRPAIATALVAGIVLTAAAPAAAVDAPWWYDAYSVPAAHEAGWTGEGVKIVVIDNQINPDLPMFEGTNLTVDPEPLCEGRAASSTVADEASLHGTQVTGQIIANGQGPAGVRGIAPDAEVVFYAYGPEPEGSETDTCTVPEKAYDAIGAGEDGERRELSGFGWGLRRAMDEGADIVATSVTLSETTTADAEQYAEAIARGMIIVAAAPNEPTSPAPWGIRGVVAVNAMDASGTLRLNTDWGLPNVQIGTTVLAAGVDLPLDGTVGDWNAPATRQGSSFATPLVAGMLAAVWQKYPDATGNQIIQSLIRNTGLEDHELQLDEVDGYGYGIASLTHMLRVDPTQYDDVNPLLDKQLRFEASSKPSDEQLEAAAAALATPTAAPTGDAVPAASAGGGMGAIIVIVAVVVVLLVAAAVITIVIVTRKNRQNTGPRSTS